MSLPFHTDPYEILNVSKTATQKEIKQAYRKLILQYHPDKKQGSSYEFQVLQEAYRILGNPDLRKLYDQQKMDPRQQILTSLNRLTYLLKHNIVYGSQKNILLILLASTALYTASWWGVLLSVLTVTSLVLSTRSWLNLRHVR